MRFIVHALLFFTVAMLFFIQGCTVVGPKYTPALTPPLPPEYEQNLTKSDPKILDWWKQFNDPTLDTLVQKAYDQNLDLQSAGLRIVAARSALGVSESLTAPQKRTINASLMGVRNSGETFTTGGVSFDSGWEIDFWGKYARGIESSQAQYYASIASYDDILVTIISEVARNYINYRTFQERIRHSTQNIEIQKRIVKMTEVQFNSGTVSELDMQQARSQLYAIEANLPTFELQSTQALNAIAVLLGTTPQNIQATIQSKTKAPATAKPNTKKTSFVQLSNEVQAPSDIPTIILDMDKPINAADLLKRPDLRVAELQAISKNAQIGAAKANLYPSFTLVGSIGFNANSANGSWSSPSNALSVGIGPSISWNPFYDDFYKNQIRIADAQFQESLINYNQQLLKAIQEVSNATQGYILTTQQYKLNKQVIQASKRAFNLSSIQYDNGMVTYQRLLNTMESVTRSEDNIAITRGNIALHAISLYKALGGGLKIASDKQLIHQDTAKTMRERTDWGKLLDANQTTHPKVKP